MEMTPISPESKKLCIEFTEWLSLNRWNHLWDKGKAWWAKENGYSYELQMSTEELFDYFLFHKWAYDQLWSFDEKMHKWKRYRGSDETGAYFQFKTTEQLLKIYKE